MSREENIDRILHYLLSERGEDPTVLPATLHDKQRLMRALMNVWVPREITSEFLAAQDAELQQQVRDKGIVDLLLSLHLEKADSPANYSSDKGEARTRLLLWQGDITRLKVDAIVNAANAQGLGCWAPLHNCIDNCIHSAAGIQLRRECNDVLQGRLLKTGEAIMTKGYNLPAKYVIHTVGPIISHLPATPEQEEQLAQCYRTCLELAEQEGLESIAFCCISTGVFHFPNERAAEIAVRTVMEYSCRSLKTVVFNVFLDKDRDIYRQLNVFR